MKPESSFVNLHVHSTYSMLDGSIRLTDLIHKCKEYGLAAAAVTDHGNMMSMVKLYKEGKKQGVKTIIGTEFYVHSGGLHIKEKGVKSNHLVLLAKNKTGISNLIKLNTIGYVKGFYYKPRIDWEVLYEHREGLICLSACIVGELGWSVLRGDSKAFWETLGFYQETFGEDYYLEIQPNSLPEQKAVNHVLKQVSRDENIPLVMTTDAHYLDRADASVHDVLLCIQTKAKVSQETRMKMPTDEFFLYTPEDIYAAVQDEQDIEAIQNTLVVADKCSLELELGINKMPLYNVAQDQDWNKYRELSAC